MNEGSVASAWIGGAFAIKCQDGKGESYDVPIAGWIKAPFALDFRVFLDEDDDYRKGWVLTHVPTGYIVAKLNVDREEAMLIGDEILLCADWNFAEPKPDPSVGLAVKPIFEKLGQKRVGWSDIGPIWPLHAASRQSCEEG